MKTQWKTAIALLMMIALSSTSTVQSQEQKDIEVDAGNVQVDVDRDPARAEERREAREARRVEREESRDARQQARAIREGQEKAEVAQRASQLMGMEIRNAAGKQIGSVNDIVLDVTTGKVRYAAISYGGFLGIGDKLFAVPWKTFKTQKAEDGDYFLILDVAEETLKNAPGFNEDKWPDFGNPKWSDEVDAYYDRNG